MFALRSLIVLCLFVPFSISFAHAATDFVPREWNDFPVRIEIEDETQLQRLEQLLPGRGRGDHDHVRDGRIDVRVTDAEFRRLREAGFAPERIEDVARAARTAVEREWAALDTARGLGDFTWPLTTYPTHAEVGAILEDLQALRPDIALRYPYGTSVDGRQLWGLVIGDFPDSNEVEPEVRLASGIHGDETVQMVNLLNFAHELVTGYETAGDARIDAIVEGIELHVQPLFNPDGYVRGIRRNANNVDLNRNFPEPAGQHSTQQPETLAFMQHALSKHFVVSLMGHGGALVVNYPWDYTYTRAPDDAALIQLSLEYSQHNLPMYNGFFSQGITNGADWYVATGTLQDWVYDQTGCLDVTLEVSNTKWPSSSTLTSYWNDNRESLYAYVEAVWAGIHGVVTDANTGAPLDAVITVSGIDEPVMTDPATGDWYKLVDTGRHAVTVDAVGYVPQTFFSVFSPWGTATAVDAQLVPEATDTPSALARAPRIERVAPNPFNPRTRIDFSLPVAGAVSLDVLDARGRRVRTLVDGDLAAGTHEITWDGRDATGSGVGSGVYFVRLRADGVTRSARITLVP